MSLSRCFRDLTVPSAVAVGKQERNGDRGVPSFNFPDSAMPPILAIGSLPVLVTAHLAAPFRVLTAPRFPNNNASLARSLRGTSSQIH